MMIMMVVTLQVSGPTTAPGNSLVDYLDTVASASGKGRAIIAITISATNIITIANVSATAIASINNIITIIVITIIGR